MDGSIALSRFPRRCRIEKSRQSDPEIVPKSYQSGPKSVQIHQKSDLGTPRGAQGSQKRKLMKKGRKTKFPGYPKCGQNIAHSVSVAHCTLLQKKVQCATDTLFTMFSADSVVRGSWPRHPFWDTWATFGTTRPTFSPFWGEKLMVCSTIAVLMAKVSESGRPNVAKP